MAEPIQDGRPLVSGTIKAEDQQREIHRAAEADRRLTPAQAARVARDEFPGDGPPGWTKVKIAAEDVAVVFGQRPPRKRTNAAEPDAAWEKVDGSKTKKSSSSSSPAENDNEKRTALRAAAREGRRLVNEAKANGTADADLLKAGTRLAERLARGLKK